MEFIGHRVKIRPIRASMEAATTPADSPTMIKPINKSVVHRICAGQVILDLAAAVKELVENSLDAGATSIEISLKEHGEEWFQVIDNGSGISPNNFKVPYNSEEQFVLSFCAANCNY